jgi:AcrR family transcriptional regulator
MRIRDENKEEAIRKKAMHIIVSKGIDGLSMQQLAKAAKVSPATIYIYYKDREDLILALYIRANERMAEATLKNFDPDMSFSEGLRNQWKNRAKYWMDNPVEAQFLEAMRHSNYNSKLGSEMKRHFFVKMHQFIQGCVQRGELIRLPVEVFWSVAYAPLYQLVRFHNNGKGLRGDDFKLNRKSMNQALDLVIKALTP